MRVFLSWSGSASRYAAEALAEWLKILPFNEIDPWVSGDAIDPGTRWSKELSQALEDTDFGILCVTKSNQQEPWVCYEAGALSKKFEKSFVVPLLLDFSASDLEQPIKQFQAINSDKDGIWKLVNQLYILDKDNSRSELVFKTAFDALWPTLEAQIEHSREMISSDLDPGSVVFDTEGSIRKIGILVESISERITRIENMPSFGNPLSGKEASFKPIEYQKQLTEINQKLDNLNKFDQVSELIRQADFLRNTNPQQSVIIYDKALEIYQDDAALIGKAKAYRKLDKWKKALEILDGVVSDNPAAERAYYNRACYKNLSGEYSIEDVLNDLEVAISLFDKYRQYAMVDIDFENIKVDPKFMELCFDSEEP